MTWKVLEDSLREMFLKQRDWEVFHSYGASAPADKPVPLLSEAYPVYAALRFTQTWLGRHERRLR